MIFLSVHVMMNVGKHCSCVCNSLEVTTDKKAKAWMIDGIVYKQTGTSY